MRRVGDSHWIIVGFMATSLLPNLAIALPFSKYCTENGHEILRTLSALVAIPNTESDADGLKRNAEAIKTLFERGGLNARLLNAKNPGTPPAVYAEWLVPGASRTLVFYAHYDGVIVDPEKWTASKPFEPTLRNGRYEEKGEVIPLPSPGESINPAWRLYGRSASDAKAGLIAIITAIKSLKAASALPTSNLKIFIDGEEEIGSPHLGEIIDQNKDLLKADAWIVHDSPLHPSGRKMVVFGIRGATVLDMTVYGAKKPLHSGHYGNWAPNPAMRLARLLASMKNDAGKVLIRGFYEDVDPIGRLEHAAIRDLALYDSDLKKKLGFTRSEGDGKSLFETLMLPSLNIRGLESGRTGDSATMTIPATATASLDLRLVKGNDKLRQVGKVIKHIEKQGYHVIDHDPTDEERLRYPWLAKVTHHKGNNAERVPMDLPLSKAVAQAVQSTTKDPIIKLPTMGGSLPLEVVTEKLGAPAFIVPVANADNNQHAENENLRIGALWDGVETAGSIMLMK